MPRGRRTKLQGENVVFVVGVDKESELFVYFPQLADSDRRAFLYNKPFPISP